MVESNSNPPNVLNPGFGKISNPFIYNSKKKKI